MKPVALCCVSALLFCGIARADDSIEWHVLGEAATRSVHEPEWAERFLDRIQSASSAAAARCSKDGKIASARYWQTDTLQLTVSYRCVAPDDPDLLVAQTIQPTISAREIQLAEKMCTTLGKKIGKTGVDRFMFYTCVSPGEAAAKPAEPPK